MCRERAIQKSRSECSGQDENGPSRHIPCFPLAYTLVSQIIDCIEVLAEWAWGAAREQAAEVCSMAWPLSLVRPSACCCQSPCPAYSRTQITGLLLSFLSPPFFPFTLFHSQGLSCSCSAHSRFLFPSCTMILPSLCTNAGITDGMAFSLCELLGHQACEAEVFFPSSAYSFRFALFVSF